jgi:WD repeat-containing protein 48
MEAVAPWCSIDTRTGRLAVVLEEYNCFDAEMYADELQLEEPIEFRDDQRSKLLLSLIFAEVLTVQLVNLGKWILRHIFSNLIDEMIKRDEVYRTELNENVKKSGQRINVPTSIQIPASSATGWQDGLGSALTPRANGNPYPMTPGMGIGVATPAPLNHLPGVPEDGALLDKRASQTSRTSAEKSGDYFSSTLISSEVSTKPTATPSEAHDEKLPKSPSDADKENNGKDSNTLFGKKFRMSFGSKKLGRSASTNIDKPVVVDEKVEDGSETSENGEKEKEVDDNFFGIVQRIRNEYDKSLLESPEQPVESGITPSLPNETPVLKPPPMTTVIIQEETSGGSADLYRGTVATVGEDASLIEERAPMWLGDLLLKVRFSKLHHQPNSNCRVEQDPFEGAREGVFRTAAMAGSPSKHCRSRWQFALKRK